MELKNFLAKATSKSLAYSEIDKYARMTYFANWPQEPKEVLIEDIRSVTACPDFEVDSVDYANHISNEIPNHDILFAGFPCQPFSIMGKGAGFDDERGTLFFDIHEILKYKQPDYFILENVQRLVTLNKGAYFKTICTILKDELGYTMKPFMINSSDYGVPQTRRRVYFVGIKKPTEKQKEKLEETAPNPPVIEAHEAVYSSINKLLEKSVDKKYYLSEKIKQTILSNGTGGWLTKSSDINKDPARPLTKTMHKMHRASQDNYYSDNFILGLGDPNDKKCIRRITPIEAFRLQGFDDDFVFNAQKAKVSDTQLYMQAGNAVTTNVVTALLKYIFSN